MGSLLANVIFPKVQRMDTDEGKASDPLLMYGSRFAVSIALLNSVVPLLEQCLQTSLVGQDFSLLNVL